MTGSIPFTVNLARMYGQAKIPRQRIPLSQKSKKWREECVEAYIDLSSHYTIITTALLMSRTIDMTSSHMSRLATTSRQSFVTTPSSSLS